MYFGIKKGRNILFRILSCHHKDLWYPCQLSKYSPSNDTEPTRTIFKPTTCSRFFTIYRPDLLTKMEASTSQDVIDLTIPTNCLKTSSHSNSPTVSEQLHLLTNQVNQLKIDSQQALDQTKPLIQPFHWLILNSSSTFTQFNIR